MVDFLHNQVSLPERISVHSWVKTAWWFRSMILLFPTIQNRMMVSNWPTYCWDDSQPAKQYREHVPCVDWSMTGPWATHTETLRLNHGRWLVNHALEWPMMIILCLYLCWATGSTTWCMFTYFTRYPCKVHHGCSSPFPVSVLGTGGGEAVKGWHVRRR